MDFIALFLQILEQSDVRSTRQCCLNSKIMTCFDVLFYLIQHDKVGDVFIDRRCRVVLLLRCREPFAFIQDEDQ